MKKQVLLLCAIALCTITMNAQADIQKQWVGTTTDWHTVGNWSDEDGNGVTTIPEITNDLRLYAADGNADIDIMADAEMKGMIFGMGSTDFGKMTVKNNSTLSVGNLWSAVAFSAAATLEIEAGSTVNFTSHLWMSRKNTSAVGIVNVYGTMTVGGNFGMNWQDKMIDDPINGGKMEDPDNPNGENPDGSGQVNIYDAGMVTLNEFNAVRALRGDNYKINLVGNGVLKINGDAKATVETYIANSQFLGDGAAFGVEVILGADGNTYVTHADYDGVALGTLSLEDYSTLKFSVYPNPSSDRVRIESNSAISNVRMYNSLGKEVLNVNSKSNIDISSLSSGLYVLKAQDVEGNLGVQRVVKQ